MARIRGGWGGGTDEKRDFAPPSNYSVRRCEEFLSLDARNLVSASLIQSSPECAFIAVAAAGLRGKCK